MKNDSHMDEERIKLVQGVLDNEYLEQFEAVKEELSFNGAIRISEGSVIKFLLQSRKTNLARIAELEKAIKKQP